MGTPRIRIRDDGGTLRTVTQLRMRDSGGTLRTITRVRVRDASNVLRVVYDTAGTSTFSASASPDSVGGHSMGVGTVITVSTTVTATGGTAPYTYAWAVVSYTHATTAPTATSPAAASTTFRQTNVGPAESYSSLWRCTVTDSATPANTATADVEAFFLDTT